MASGRLSRMMRRSSATRRGRWTARSDAPRSRLLAILRPALSPREHGHPRPQAAAAAGSRTRRRLLRLLLALLLAAPLLPRGAGTVRQAHGRGAAAARGDGLSSRPCSGGREGPVQLFAWATLSWALVPRLAQADLELLKLRSQLLLSTLEICVVFCPVWRCAFLDDVSGWAGAPPQGCLAASTQGLLPTSPTPSWPPRRAGGRQGTPARRPKLPAAGPQDSGQQLVVVSLLHASPAGQTRATRPHLIDDCRPRPHTVKLLEVPQRSRLVLVQCHRCCWRRPAESSGSSTSDAPARSSRNGVRRGDDGRWRLAPPVLRMPLQEMFQRTHGPLLHEPLQQPVVAGIHQQSWCRWWECLRW